MLLLLYYFWRSLRFVTFHAVLQLLDLQYGKLVWHFLQQFCVKFVVDGVVYVDFYC